MKAGVKASRRINQRKRDMKNTVEETLFKTRAERFNDVLESRIGQAGLNPTPKRTNILTEAQEIIYGERERTYGDPGKNLSCIADMWMLYLHHKYGAGFPLDFNDVCAMMRLVKEARMINTPGHRDSMVDMAGYTALQERVQNANQARVQENYSKVNEPGPRPRGHSEREDD